MPRLIIALFFFTSLFVVGQPAQAQSGIQISQPRVDYQFGEQAVFQARVQADFPISAIFLSFQSQGQGIETQKVIPDAQGGITYTANLQDGSLRPFARVDYWFTVESGDGQDIASPTYSFIYIDNRYDWQTFDKGLFHVHWIDGDLSFGQAAENVAEQSLAVIQNLFPIQHPNDAFEIYIYPHPEDLQAGLSVSSATWVAGHANPDLGVILVSVPLGPEQQLQMEQQIPHELAHVMLYQKTGLAYKNLPMWLNEGLASSAELYPNVDYARSLSAARQNGSLFSMESLCQAFPTDAAGIIQAYAQSASFTQFLQKNFGSSGINNLVLNYMNGMGCSEAVLATFSQTLQSLDARWAQENAGLNAPAASWQTLLAYLILSGLLLVFTLVPGLWSYRQRRSIVSPGK